MKYEEHYAEIDQKTDEFLSKWGDIDLDLDTIFSNWICTFRINAFMTKCSWYESTILCVCLLSSFFHVCMMK